MEGGRMVGAVINKTNFDRFLKRNGLAKYSPLNHPRFFKSRLVVVFVFNWNYVYGNSIVLLLIVP